MEGSPNLPSPSPPPTSPENSSSSSSSNHDFGASTPKAKKLITFNLADFKTPSEDSDLSPISSPTYDKYIPGASRKKQKRTHKIDNIFNESIKKITKKLKGKKLSSNLPLRRKRKVKIKNKAWAKAPRHTMKLRSQIESDRSSPSVFEDSYI